MKKKSSQNKRDSFWEVLATFVFVENESGTYSEIIDRMKFYLENQKILKKTPKSATVQNACLLEFSRRLFRAIPKKIPKTQYLYLKLLLNEFMRFDAYMQDNFMFMPMESDCILVLSLLKQALPLRFMELNKESSYIEECGKIARILYGNKSNKYYECVEKLDSFREESQDIFNTLQCFLDSTGCLLFNDNNDWKNKSTDNLLGLCYAYDQTGHYDFTWEGRDIVKLVSECTETGTLIPKKEDSKNWETTQNLYIEGNNLRVMKLLLPSYEGKIKMIYIDPPYNTGHHFLYDDDYNESIEIFEKLLFAKYKHAQDRGSSRIHIL